MIPNFNLSSLRENPQLLNFLDKATFSRPPTFAEVFKDLLNEIVSHGKDILISLFALVSVSVFTYICITIVINETSSPDDKKWATSIITLITSGVVGYLTGKASK
jgi:hypothetical protein